jgi:hypothetical protein
VVRAIAGRKSNETTPAYDLDDVLSQLVGAATFREWPIVRLDRFAPGVNLHPFHEPELLNKPNLNREKIVVVFRRVPRVE